MRAKGVSSEVVSVIVIVVATVGVGGYFLLKGKGEEGQVLEESQMWWIASDSHLGVHGENLDALKVAIEDANDLGIADYAIQLGDEIHETMAYRENSFQLMDSLEVENWYFLGNHDFENPPREENLLPPVDVTLDTPGMPPPLKFVSALTESKKSPKEKISFLKSERTKLKNVIKRLQKFIENINQRIKELEITASKT